MNELEALRIISEYQQNPPKPSLEYYKDPYADGYQNASRWYNEYPPMSSRLIDAILERDKNCKPYDLEKDSTEIKDEKLCGELAKRFTDLMKRAGNSVVDEYNKKNSHLYSMVTEYDYKKITIIPMSLSTLVDFKEKCKKVSSEIGLKNFYIYEYKDDKDVDGKMVYGHAPYSGFYLTDNAKDTFRSMCRYCDYFKKYAKESSNQELISNLCDNIKEYVENLYNIINADYLQRIDNYISKEQAQLGSKNYE